VKIEDKELFESVLNEELSNTVATEIQNQEKLADTKDKYAPTEKARWREDNKKYREKIKELQSM
jgi:sensor domain CHASE-containing protein